MIPGEGPELVNKLVVTGLPPDCEVLIPTLNLVLPSLVHVHRSNARVVFQVGCSPISCFCLFNEFFWWKTTPLFVQAATRTGPWVRERSTAVRSQARTAVGWMDAWVCLT